MNFLKHDCKDELKKADLKVTPARIAVMKYLESVKNPTDVDSIIEAVEKEVNVDPATIYRIINTFFEKGIIERIEFGEGKYRYEVAGHHHHHLICTNCRKIEDVEGDYINEIETEIRGKKGFLVKSHSLEFFGLCRNCQL